MKIGLWTDGRTDEAPPFLKRLVRLHKAEKRAAVRAPFWWLQRLDFIECEVIDATGKEDGALWSRIKKTEIK